MKFIFQNCSICRLECFARKEPNIEGLPLSTDTKKHRGQCIVKNDKVDEVYRKPSKSMARLYRQDNLEG